MRFNTRTGGPTRLGPLVDIKQWCDSGRGIKDSSNVPDSGERQAPGRIDHSIRRDRRAHARSNRREPVELVVVRDGNRRIDIGDGGVADRARAEIGRPRLLARGLNVRFKAEEPAARLPVVACLRTAY
jgi:hypothetical protein